MLKYANNFLVQKCVRFYVPKLLFATLPCHVDFLFFGVALFVVSLIDESRQQEEPQQGKQPQQ